MQELKSRDQQGRKRNKLKRSQTINTFTTYFFKNPAYRSPKKLFTCTEEKEDGEEDKEEEEEMREEEEEEGHHHLPPRSSGDSKNLTKIPQTTTTSKLLTLQKITQKGLSYFCHFRTTL